MRRCVTGPVAVLIGAVLVFGALAVAPTAAGAISKKQCKALLKVGSVDTTGSNKSFDPSRLKAIGKSFSKTASKESGKLKGALKTIAGLYNSASNADNAADAAQKLVGNGVKYTKALGAISKAITQCTLSTVPSTP